jgi:hypothetical protein
MSSCRGLDIVLRVPITVEDDDYLCSRQVDALPTSFSGEQKDVTPFVRVVKTVNGILTIHRFDIARNLLVLNLLDLHVVLKQTDHLSKL